MKYRWVCRVVLLCLLAGAGHAQALEGNYHLKGKVGLGYDSNPLLAPGRSYFDPFLGQVVDPNKDSGFFIPMGFKGEYEYGPDKLKSISGIAFRGAKYLGSDVNNADNYFTKVETGLEFLLQKKGRLKDRFYIGPSITYNKEIYFDRDTGLEKTTKTTGQDISDRYKYVRYMMEAKLKVRSSPVKYALNAKLAKYDYEEVPVLSSLDYVYYLIGAEAEYDITKKTNIEAGFDYYVRDYKDRHARDRNGNILISNPKLEYSYYKFRISLRQDLTKNWTLYLDYDHLIRSDEFEDYNEYNRNRYRFRPKYSDKQGRKFAVEVTYWERDYPRAFVFDQSGLPKKSYETWEWEVSGEHPLTGIWNLWAEMEYVNQDSADPRYGYDRFQIMAGVGAEF